MSWKNVTTDGLLAHRNVRAILVHFQEIMLKEIEDSHCLWRPNFFFVKFILFL